MTIARWLTLLVPALLAPAARADQPAGGKQAHGFVERTYKDADGAEAKYALFVPHGYTGEKPYPVILFLHGAGETKGGRKMPVEVGIGPAIKKQEQTFPFLAVIPQSQNRTWQAGSPDANRALGMLDQVMKDYKVDPRRVYLTGLSMGGYGTWSLAAAQPERWAAIVPICGGARGKLEEVAQKIKDIPCWCFHGEKDPAVPVENSRRLVKALEAAGGHPKYTEFPGVNHYSWDPAYATPELFPWLLEQSKK
jgi:predicted peptidase